MLLNREVATEWVKRLRSGEYQQGPGFLAIRRDGDGPQQHCCLGVLCEIAADQNVVDVRTGSTVEGITREFGYAHTIPPTAVQEWAGLEEFEGWEVKVPEGMNERIDRDYVPRDGASSVALVALNDEYGFTFEQIADLLEAEHLRD